MKVGILTFHFVNNFGGALQAYALQKTVSQKCGAEVLMVDYRNLFIRFTDMVRILPITTNWREILSGIATIKLRMTRMNKFKKFHKDYFNMTPRYNTARALRKQPPACDKYICGSDQIWNPVITFGVSEPYFLGFEENGQNKIAYAPSFGTSNLKNKQVEKVRKYLTSFRALSVREKESVSKIKEITGRDAIQLIDPTFMLDKEEWSKVAVEPKVNGKYILLYIMQRDETVYEYARKLKEELNLPIIEISRYGLHMDFVDDCMIDVGPAEFLGLFKNAECVCTNSYHGLAFSVIFEKALCLVPCKRFRNRIDSLLELFQCELTTEKLINVSYDRRVVKDVILNEREKAINYLCYNIER